MRLDRGQAVRWGLALVPAWFTFHFLADTWVDPVVRGLVALLAVVAAVAPVEGLVALTLIAPLGDLLAIGFDQAPRRLVEACALAFLAGWLLHPCRARRTVPRPHPLVSTASAILGAIVLASFASHALAFWHAAPGAAARAAQALVDHYTMPLVDPFGAVAAAHWIEGLALAAAVVDLLGRQPMVAVWVPEALAAGCVATTAASTLLWFGVGFAPVLERHALIAPRVVAHISDVNAAGSYFALVACVAIGMAARATGARRWWWTGGAATALFGLWLSRSRSAEIAIVLASAPALWWLATTRLQRRVRWAGMVALAGSIGVAAVAASRTISDQSTTYRTLFTETAYRVVHAYPWFGIGVGRFYDLSPLFMSPRLAWAYGMENAHDYWLQTMAEIGILGVIACLAALAGIAMTVGRTVEQRARERYRVLGLATGVAAFLLTCLTGHPLLVLESAYPFWIALGLLVALVGAPRADAPDRARRPSVAFVAAAIVLLAVTVPIRARQRLPGARAARDIDGLYGWEDGGRYRWMEPYAGLFVPRSVRRVEIPMRLPASVSRETNEVKIAVGRDLVGSVTVGPDWTNAIVTLPQPGAVDRFVRLNLHAERAITIPAPSGGTREVGVEIGPLRVLELAEETR